MQAVKDRVKEMLRMEGESSTGLAKRAADRLGERQSRIDATVDQAVSGKKSASSYSRGGKTKRMGYGVGGVVGQAMGRPQIGDYIRQMQAQRKSPPVATSNPRMLLKAGRVRFAKGGAVSRGEAKKIAERTVSEHVKYPAPKGHKGLGKMCS
jgi:hypothetical protein